MNPVPKRRKRMYYSAGLLSLLLFPLLCLHFMGQNGLYTDLRMMPINWYNEDLRSEITPQLFPHDFRTAKKYVDITLTDDKASNQNKLAVARLQVRALRLSGDTTQGLHFHFHENMPYEAFIQVLNICELERVSFFVPEGSDIWIFNHKRKPNPDYKPYIPPCGNEWLAIDDWPPKSEEELWEEKLGYLKESLPVYTPSIALFLAMVAASIWFQKGYFQTFK